MSIFNSDARQAWKCFFLTLLVALTIPVLTDKFFGEFVVRKSVFKKAHDTLHEGNIDVVFIGSSHFYAGIHPEAFNKKIVILSLPYLDTRQMKALVEANWEAISKAKQVVLEFTPEAFTIDAIGIYGGQSLRLQEQGVSHHYPPSHWVAKPNRNMLSLFPYLMRFRVRPDDIRYHFELQGRVDKIKSLEKYGFKAYRKKSDKKNLEKHTKKWIETMRENFLGEDIQYKAQIFRELVEKLKNSGLDVRLLQMPYYSGFRQTLHETYPFFYDEFVPQVNLPFLDLVPTGSDEDFYDSNHLNIEGALRASEKVSHWLSDSK